MSIDARRACAPLPDLAALEAKHEAEAATRRDEAMQRRAEDVAFRERLLGAIEDQNTLIRALLDHVTRRPPPAHDQPPNER